MGPNDTDQSGMTQEEEQTPNTAGELQPSQLPANQDTAMTNVSMHGKCWLSCWLFEPL